MWNILFVTEDSLDEQAFKGLCHFWSVKVVQLPEVHEERVNNVSWHLSADGIDPKHVFLKLYTWKVEAEAAIISDVDCMLSLAELFDSK